MSSVHKMLRVLTLAVMVGAALVTQTEAATISISPVSQDAAIGDTVVADILVSLGAGESIGGASFFLNFNDSILSGLSFVADPDDKMGVAGCGFCDFSGGFSGGNGSPLDMFFIADPVLYPDNGSLAASQGAGFRLATVSFTAIANGFSGLTLADVFLSDSSGQVEVPSTARNGSVCVGGNCTAPEPGLLSLLGAGFGAFMVRRRARARV